MGFFEAWVLLCYDAAANRGRRADRHRMACDVRDGIAVRSYGTVVIEQKYNL